MKVKKKDYVFFTYNNMAKTGKNKGYTHKKNNGVTPNHVMVWAMRKAEMPIAKVAKVLDISPRSVSRYFEDMENFVGREFDENLLRKNLLGLYPKALMALERLIDADNPQTVIAFFKGQNIWQDKQTGDNNIQVIVTQEGKAQIEENRRKAHDRLGYSSDN